MDAKDIVCNNPGCDECHPPTHLCAKCQKRIPYMEGSTTNHDGGMRLFFQGWYGGTIDPFRDVSALLCEACALEFLNLNAWLGEFDQDLSVPTA